MRAARFHGRDEGLVVEDIPRPEAGPGDVLVKVEACGLCHSDLHFLQGDMPIPTPRTLGHETAGTVVEVGDGVEHVEEGTSVVVYGGWGCGHCRVCTRGEDQLCNVMEWEGIGAEGGFAEYLRVPDPRYVLPIGDLDPRKAAPLTDAALTPYRAVRKAREHLTPAKTVVVIGIGGLGQYGVQFAAMTGAQVVAVDIDTEKLALAERLGADVTIAAAEERVPSAIRTAAGGDGADVAIDFVGNDETLQWCENPLTTQGQLYIVGLGDGEFGVSFNPLVGSELAVSSVHWGSINELRDVIALARAERLDIGVETIGFDELTDTFERLANGGVDRRVALVPEQQDSLR
jgi:propanol-preferring alcohol dehydrogenase